MKIFITGGTGFIGGHLLNILSGTEHELHCLARKTSDIRQLKEAGAKICIGDLLDKNSLLEGMKGCDSVIHLASSFVFWVPDSKVYAAVNVTGTQNLMETALETAIKKVVHVSTAAVWGNAASPTNEDTPFGTERASEYVKTKYEGDLIVRRLYHVKGLPLVIIYPSAVMGPNDPKACGRYIRNFALGKMPAQVLTDIMFPFVHVRDVGHAIVKALEKQNNIGEQYIISNENLTFGQINEMVREISGTKLPFLKLPNWLTRVNAFLLTGLANLIKKPPLWDLSVDQVGLMSQPYTLDGSKAERELGIKYTPIRRAIEESIATISR